MRGKGTGAGDQGGIFLNEWRGTTSILFTLASLGLRHESKDEGKQDLRTVMSPLERVMWIGTDRKRLAYWW